MISDSARLHVWLGVAAFAAIGGLTVGVVSTPAAPYRAENPEPAYCTTPAPRLILSGKAAYAEDVKTGRVLYAENQDVQLPLASLTKVMTILTASKNLPEGSTTLITKAALTPEGDAGLFENEEWRTQDLIDFTLMTSANDGAHALALAASAIAGQGDEWFVGEMNQNARAMGLDGTYFLNDTGLDISSTTAGAYGSARDIAHLLRYAIAHAPRTVEATSGRTRIFVSESNKKHEATNTTSVAAAIDGLVASKTGFTDLAGGNLVAMFEPLPGRPVVATIMGGEREERDSDMKLLAEAAVKELKRNILCEQFHGSH
jgi:D-alanyl-D-alanine carboxypeptidase